MRPDGRAGSDKLQRIGKSLAPRRIDSIGVGLTRTGMGLDHVLKITFAAKVDQYPVAFASRAAARRNGRWIAVRDCVKVAE